MFKFVWNNKPSKIKKQTLLQTLDKDGLKMIDLEKNCTFFKSKLGETSFS